MARLVPSGFEAPEDKNAQVIEEKRKFTVEAP